MPSNVAGYLAPTINPTFPGGLTLTQFIQSLIVGTTGYAGALVRPKWQVEQPKQPDITVNWIAFGIQIITPDQFAYVAMSPDETTSVGSSSISQRQALIQIDCSFYGPAAMENILIFQDAFQIQQNLEPLRAASMGYRMITPAVRGPDLVNGRWVERLETSLYLTWQVQRTYQILSLESAEGSIHTVISGGEFNTDWQTPEES